MISCFQTLKSYDPVNHNECFIIIIIIIIIISSSSSSSSSSSCII